MTHKHQDTLKRFARQGELAQFILDKHRQQDAENPLELELHAPIYGLTVDEAIDAMITYNKKGPDALRIRPSRANQTGDVVTVNQEPQPAKAKPARAKRIFTVVAFNEKQGNELNEAAGLKTKDERLRNFAQDFLALKGKHPKTRLPGLHFGPDHLARMW